MNELSLVDKSALEELANYNYDQGLYEKALQYYTEALSSTKNPALIHLRRSLCLYNMEKFKEAERAIQNTLALSPDLSVAHAYYAHLILVSIHRLICIPLYPQRFRQAKQEISKALALDPDSAIVHYYAGWMANVLEKKKKAKEHFQKALSLDPNDTASLLELAKLYLSEDLSKARHYILEVLSLDPESAEAHQIYGKICEKEGKREASLHHYRLAQKLNPQEADKLQAQVRSCQKKDPLAKVTSRLSKALLYSILGIPFAVIVILLAKPLGIIFFLKIIYDSEKNRQNAKEKTSFKHYFTRRNILLFLLVASIFFALFAQTGETLYLLPALIFPAVLLELYLFLLLLRFLLFHLLIPTYQWGQSCLKHLLTRQT